MPTNRNHRVHVRLAPKTERRLYNLAQDRGVPVSSLAADLLEQALDDQERYLGRQSGHVAVMALALVTRMARNQLDPKEIAAAQATANEIGKRMFGEVPRRPFEVDLDGPVDPRLEALHQTLME